MSFFRNARGSSIEGAGTIDSQLLNSKNNIRSALIDAIKELQVRYKDTTHSSTIGTNEDSTILLNTLEALLIHGLKDNQSSWTKRVSAVTRAMDPSFWTYVLIFSHKDTIRRIDSLKQISSDVGRSRAWLRLALNDGFLSSYLNMMMADKISAQRFYERGAILRDSECLDVIAKYITGIEIYKFDLALNSGLLNKWSKAPLTIAGLIQASDSQVVAVAVEAAEEMIDESTEPLTSISKIADPQNDHTEQPSRLSGYNLKRGLLNEDEALEIILKGGSGFGTPSLGQSPKVTDSPKIGSYTATDINKIKKYSPSRDRNKSSSPNVNLSESCPSSNQILSNSLKAEQPSDSNDCDKLQPNERDVPDICDTKSDSVNEQLSDPHKQPCETSPSASELLESQISERLDRFHRDEHKQHEESLSSSDSEEEISIYQPSRRKDHIQKSLESTTPESFPSSKNIPVIPLINAINAHDQADTAQITKIKPCDTISASDVEDDFTNIIVTASVSPPLVSQSPKTSSISNETVKILPCLSGFIDSWKPFGRTQRFFDTPPDNESNHVQSFGFRFQRDVTVPGLNVADSQYMLQLFDYIDTEKGLDWQNYQCFECTRAIGTIFGPAKLCSYTKRYYCEECHIDEISVIPARIVYNWDFKEYKICKKAKIFLNALRIEPILDASTFNENLFDYASELKTVFTLRKELKFINAYLSTCTSTQKPNPKKTFDKMLFPRTYLYEDIHKYSIQDLEDVNNGKLKTTLQEVTRFARMHILGGCILCAGKGFICEVCKDKEPLYPFDLESIVQCEKCFAVFHPECSFELKNCTKCDRIEARTLKWHVFMSQNDRELSTVNGEQSSIEIPSN